MNIKYDLFVGTYTQNTLSKGIYRCGLNSNGKLTRLSEVSHNDNPSFLCLSKENDVLYAASENLEYASVTAYDIKSSKAEKLTEFKFAGSLLCHISTTELHNNILGACYQSGDIFSIMLDGSNTVLSHHVHKFDGKTSHPHYISLDKSGRFAISVDLGLDTIFIYRIKSGRLTLNKFFNRVILKDGEGPRHLVFHPFLETGYVVTEISNKVFTFQFNDNTGEMKIIDWGKCLPISFKSSSSASELVISQDGRYLYVSNRGANTITLFKISDQGKLEKVGYHNCFGDWPGHIYLTHDGKFMINSNQKSDEIVVAPVDEESGEILDPVEKIKIPSPTCVCEIVRN
jgi:6-phosphogluconolactonase